MDLQTDAHEVYSPSARFKRPKLASLTHEIDVLAAAHPEAEPRRRAVSKFLQELNKRTRHQYREVYQAHPYATKRLIRAYSDLTDLLIRICWYHASVHAHPNASPTPDDPLAIMAVGGYGRREMAPFSDVDLLFLSKKTATPWAEAVTETMLYTLWDAGLKIGHSTRSVEECLSLSKEDQTIRTALLESRQITGDEAVAEKLARDMRKKLFASTGSDFVELKLEERESRHLRHGGQRYLLEPNVKEGKGGLRDLQTLFWITKYLSGSGRYAEMIRQGFFTTTELDRFKQAENFLWTVRCHLHLLSNRAAEKLSFEMQVEISRALDYQDDAGMRGVERFMQNYYRQATHVGELTRIFLTALEARHVKSHSRIGARLRTHYYHNWQDVPKFYEVIHGRLAIRDEAAFLAEPRNLIEIFEVALRSKLLMHPDAMRLITLNLDKIDRPLRENPEIQKTFLCLLLDFGNPERALRRMNELGVLGAFIPEFHRIIALMQFNMYHHYTVDEHTIQCISHLARIEQGQLRESLPLSSRILARGINRAVLYVALLLHDIGKGLPEDHSIAGARLAAEIAPMLGLDESESETVEWLVRHHLLMSDTAQKRDLAEPRTVRDFCAVVNSTRKLDLLTVLTVCDIRGVGPGVWNNWKAQLIRDLYQKARVYLQSGMAETGTRTDLQEKKDALKAALSDWAPAELEAELARHYPTYWLGLSLDTHRDFATLLRGASADDLALHLTKDTERGVTRACFVTADHPGVFSRLCGAIALAGGNIVDARTYTSSDGYATAVFWLQDREGHAYEESGFAHLKDKITKTLKGEIIARDAIRTRDKIRKNEREFHVTTAISFDNEGSEIYTIIEVDTRDRLGLLYDLTRTLASCHVYIASAVIATYGEQVVDVFYVKDMFGFKLHAQSKRDQIEARLRNAIEAGAREALR